MLLPFLLKQHKVRSYPKNVCHSATSVCVSLKKQGPVVEPVLIHESGYIDKFLFLRAKYYWFKY